MMMNRSAAIGAGDVLGLLHGGVPGLPAAADQALSLGRLETQGVS